MYSVIEAGGFQQKVTLGETLKIPRLAAEAGTDFVYEQVLLHANQKDQFVGQPHVEGASVTVEILSHGRGDKVKVFKKKRRQGYRRTQGHRQDYTEIIVKEIAMGSSKESLEAKALERARARVKALEKLRADTPPKAKDVKEASTPQEAAPEVKKAADAQAEAPQQEKKKS